MADDDDDYKCNHNDVLVSTEDLLSSALKLVPTAVEKAKLVKGFPSKWKMIISKMEQIPSRLSDLSCHPCFSKNALCKEQLQTVSITLKQAIELAETSIAEKFEGKLKMQSDLDALIGKLDLNLKDCSLLIKTGMLVDVTVPVSISISASQSHGNIRELLARLQIGHLESKQKALETLIEIMGEDEKTVFSVLGRSNVAALVQLLTATSPRMREMTVSVISSLAESGSCENWLISEGILPPLIRLLESGSSFGKEKAVISLQRLSISPETARSIVGHGGIRPLTEICKTGDSVVQSSAACTLKNISTLPDARQTLADKSVIKLMIELLDSGSLLGTKEYAAECLQNLTSSNDDLRKTVIASGGVKSLLDYIDSPFPQEPAIGAVRNLVNLTSIEVLTSLGLIPRLVHVLKSGSPGAQQSAAATVCKICGSIEMKRLMGEAGCIPFLIKMLDGKTYTGREMAAQAISILIAVPQNCREVKKDDKSVPNLVQSLDPSLQNTAKKYAIVCLTAISTSKRCKKGMISYGAIGYLKKLCEMEVVGAKKLLDRLERGKIRSFFSRK